MSKEMIEEKTNFEYSLIRPDDFLELKTLHEQLLPVCTPLRVCLCMCHA